MNLTSVHTQLQRPQAASAEQLQPTHTPSCVRACTCACAQTQTILLKSEEKHKIPANGGGLGGGREEVAGDT